MKDLPLEKQIEIGQRMLTNYKDENLKKIVKKILDEKLLTTLVKL